MIEPSLTPEFVAITILSILGIYGAVRFFFKRKSDDGETVNWTPLEAICLTIVIYFLSQLLAALCIGVIGGVMGLDDEQLTEELRSNPAFQFVFILFVEALTLGFLYFFMKRRSTPWKAIGWVKPKPRDIGYTLLGFVTYFVIYAFIVFNLVEMLFPQVDTGQPQQLGFDTAISGPALLFVFLSLVILPPLVEEILVRGFLFTGLKQKMNVLVAAIVTSIVFAAAHLQWGSGAPLLWAAAADTFTLSMVLVWLRHKTGSLWPGIGVHFIKNGIAFLALFVFKGV
jgi:membrane protease YdiL (CAAX protease family)